MRTKARGNSIPMQRQVLGDTVANSHRFKKTIRIQKAAIEVRERQGRIRTEFTVYQVARSLRRSPLEMVHAISLQVLALAEAHIATGDC